jgi:hypothetical protein
MNETNQVLQAAKFISENSEDVSIDNQSVKNVASNVTLSIKTQNNMMD